MLIEPEKKVDAHIGDAAVVSASGAQETSQEAAREDAERRLVRKLDARLLSTIVILCLINYIDRAAITSARIQGLQSDLGLSDVQYDTAVAILYASYSPAQIPSNMAINHVSRPSLYISTCVVLLGLTSALTGAAHNFAGIMACRVFIGLPEAAFTPGVMYILSSWYMRKELAFRSAVFSSGMLISSAFGSLCAAGIFMIMNETQGIAAWRWLFYIEGIVTVLAGFLAMWLLPDHPSNTRWMTPAERHLAQVRLAEDTGEADQDSKQASFFEGLKLAIRDPMVLLFMLLNCSAALGLSFINFFPTLTATFGYSTTNTLLMAAPPWIVATIATLINARHSDITEERFFHQTAWFWVVMVGCIISLSTMNTAWRYLSMFLMASGSAGVALTIVWLANTIPRPPAKRSAAIGLANGFGNLGNIMGSYVWRSNWGPKYHQSMVIAFCALAFSSILSFVIRVMLVRENKRMEREELDVMNGPERERIEEAARLEGITFEEAVRRRTRFRYLH